MGVILSAPVFKTLDRYLIREILPPLFLSLLIFTFVLDIPPVMDQLEALVAKGVSWDIAARMLMLLVPQALGLTIPMSLLVGILIALGRMSSDREAVALLACGVSPYRLLRPVMVLALAAGAIHLYVMLSAIPDANQAFRALAYEVVSQKVENDVRPQVFFDDFPGWVLYARDIPKSGGGWKDVMVADTSRAESTVLYMASRGRLILNREKQTVDLVLEDGTRYSNRGPDGKEIETFRFPQQLIVKLDPQSVFPHFELMRGIHEMTIAELRAQIAEKTAHNLPVHQELVAIQQKFSFPAACLVFAIIAVALGLTVAREGKVGAFVVGIAVIFAYYVLLYLAEALTKGFYAGAAGAFRTPMVALLARWVPNLLLLPFGVLALIWRARWAEGRIPFRSVVRLTGAATAWLDKRREAANAASSDPRALGARKPRIVIVVRIPRLSWMMPNILDRYIARIYLRVAGLSFMALLGIFYISAPLLLLGAVWSVLLYGLEQRIMARANQRADALDSQIRGRPPRTLNPLNRRWLVGHDGAIYHYSYFDPEHLAIQNLVVYRPARDAWRLDSEVFTPRASFSGGQWVGTNGWTQDFTAARNRWAPFPRRPLALEPPDYFATEQPLADLMTVPQLKRFINEQAASGFNVVPQMIELQKKLAFPFVTIVMTLLAIPFGMTTGKRGTLYGIGVGIVLALGYWIVGSAFAAVGKAGLLGPMMAGWAPNVLAAGSAAYLLLNART